MNNTVTVAIVGSGFASWGAALVLAGNDQVSAKMFDIGLTQADDVDESSVVPNAKPYEGSYFSYGINDSRCPIELKSERACSSHAFGGHSTVYSGATLYPLDCELRDWPEEGRPLSIDYSAVLAKMPLLAEHDDLEGVFRLEPAQSDLAWHPGESRGFSLAGMSRIALTEFSATSGPEKPLRPFCTRDQCEEMISTGAMQYVNECYVLKVERIDNRLALHYSKNGKITSELFDAVFVGAGCVNTTAIVDRSFNLLGERHYSIKAPQGMFHALFRIPWKRSNESRIRQRNGLPELFLEVYDSKIQYPRSHTQLSPLNEQIIETIGARLPQLFRTLIHAVRHTFYFGMSAHSDGNTEMAVLSSNIVRDARGVVTQQIAITESAAERSVELIRSVRRAVFKHWRTLRMIPIPFGDTIASFFRGNRLGGWHFGGTLPMRSRPTEDGECWPSSEVNGLNGVFILDSAAFPSIPGTTVALLSAAHGHRVARSWLLRHQGCGD